MIDIVDRVLNALEEMISVVERQDYEAFLTYLSPRIKEKVDRESFQNAIRLQGAKPLSRAIFDKKASKVVSEKPLVVKLVMTNGRTLGNFIQDGEKWLTDNIFWR